jgi:hypothetical protein
MALRKLGKVQISILLQVDLLILFDPGEQLNCCSRALLVSAPYRSPLKIFWKFSSGAAQEKRSKS